MDIRDFIDLNLNEIRNFIVQVLAADPANTEARLYYNSVSHTLRYYNGTVWTDLAAATYSDEQAQDAIAAAFAAGTNTVVTVTYNDAANSLSLTIGAGQVTAAMLAAGVRLDTINAPTADVSLASHKLINVTDPTAAQDAATKAYVDALVNGLDWKADVRVATVGASITLAGSAPNALDGVTLVAGDRILVKDQATASQNGIYTVTTLGTGANGTWTRATDADASAEVTSGMTVIVSEGTVNADTMWVLTTNNPIVLATTALAFSEIPTPGMLTVTGLIVRTGNQLSLDHTSNPHVSRTWTGALVGGATSEVITHNLNTRDIQAMFWSQNTPWQKIDFTVEATSVNTATVRSGQNITAGIRAVVQA